MLVFTKSHPIHDSAEALKEAADKLVNSSQTTEKHQIQTMVKDLEIAEVLGVIETIAERLYERNIQPAIALAVLADLLKETFVNAAEKKLEQAAHFAVVQAVAMLVSTIAEQIAEATAPKAKPPTKDRDASRHLLYPKMPLFT